MKFADIRRQRKLEGASEADDSHRFRSRMHGSSRGIKSYVWSRINNAFGRLQRRLAATLYSDTLAERWAREDAAKRQDVKSLRPLTASVAVHGSQRAAAKSLGMNLSTFQRRLAKEKVVA